MRKKTHGNQKYIDTYQQNHVYFVNIACKFIMVTLLIVTILGWPLNSIFVRTVDFFVCVLFPISGVFTTHSISLIFIKSFAIENSCSNLVMPHSV